MGNEASSQYAKKIENDIKVKWSKEIAKCPYFPREGQAAAMVGTKLYLFGGVLLIPVSDEESVTETDELLVYEIESKQWSKEVTSGSCPGQRSGSTMSSINKNLYLFGGLSQMSGWMNDLFVYNTDTKVWTEIKAVDAPSPRDKVTSASIGDKIYIFGGFGPIDDDEPNVDDILPDDGDDEYEDMDELHDVRDCQQAANFTWSGDLYSFDTLRREWSLVSVANDTGPNPRAAHTLSYIKDKDGRDLLYVFGGRDAQSRRQDLWKFDLNTKQWEECKFIGCPPQPRSFHAATTVKQRLVVYGGRGMKDQHFNDLHIFDTETNEWLQPSPLDEDEKKDPILPPAVGLHSLCATDDVVVLFGGSSDLDPATGTCVKVLNDIYTIPAIQIASGGAIKIKEEVQNQKPEEMELPSVLNLKQNKNEVKVDKI